MPPKELRNRSRTLYWSSAETLRDWEALAIKSRINFSRWLIAQVQEHLAEASTEKQPNTNTNSDIQTMRAEILKLRKELEHTTVELQQKETELFKLKTKVLSEDVGRIEMDGKLLDILEDGGVWSSRDLLEALGIDSHDIDAIGSLTKLLHRLQDLGMVREGAEGWRWLK